MSNVKFNLKWLGLWVRLQLIKIVQTLVLLSRILTGDEVVQVIVEGGVVTDVMGLPRNTHYQVFDWDIMDGNTFDEVAAYLTGFDMVIDAEEVEELMMTMFPVPGLEEAIVDEIIWRW